MVGGQDELIVRVDARPRKGIYTRRSRRAAYTYTESYSKTVVFGVITVDWEEFFERHGRFTRTSLSTSRGRCTKDSAGC